jgi:hypothetical protein
MYRVCLLALLKEELETWWWCSCRRSLACHWPQHAPAVVPLLPALPCFSPFSTHSQEKQADALRDKQVATPLPLCLHLSYPCSITHPPSPLFPTPLSPPLYHNTAHSSALQPVLWCDYDTSSNCIASWSTLPQEKQADALRDKLAVRMEAPGAGPREWRCLAWCIRQLGYSEKGARGLMELTRHYKHALGEPLVSLAGSWVEVGLNYLVWAKAWSTTSSGLAFGM